MEKKLNPSARTKHRRHTSEFINVIGSIAYIFNIAVCDFPSLSFVWAWCWWADGCRSYSAPHWKSTLGKKDKKGRDK